MKKSKWASAVIFGLAPFVWGSQAVLADVNQDVSTSANSTGTSTDVNKPVQAQSQPTIVEKNSVVTIKYSGRGGVAVWKSWDTNQGVTGKYLNNNTRWASYKIASKTDGSKWYNLGGNQWVDGNYTSEENINKNSSTTSNSQTTNNSANETSDQGTLVIKYNGRGGVAVWKSWDTSQGVTGKYLANNSAWKYFKVATKDNGSKWYNLGGNQWVDGSYTSLVIANQGGQVVKEGNRYVFKDNSGQNRIGTIINGKQKLITDNYGGIYYVQNDVPVISQRPELPTGCEMTAVTMMLQSAGVNISKIQVANETPRSSDGNKGFVGSPYSTSGWWVFPSGIAPVVRRHLGTAQIMTGANLDAIKDKLIHGHVVVVWVANMNGFINHSLALTGYSNSGYLLYNNPWTGRKESISVSEFMTKWARDQKRALSY